MFLCEFSISLSKIAEKGASPQDTKLEAVLGAFFGRDASKDDDVRGWVNEYFLEHPNIDLTDERETNFYFKTHTELPCEKELSSFGQIASPNRSMSPPPSLQFHSSSSLLVPKSEGG